MNLVLLKYRELNDTIDLIIERTSLIQLQRLVKIKGKWQMTNFNKGLICGTRRYVGVYNRKYSRCQPREDTFEFTFDNCIRYETDTYDVVEIPIPDIITKACYITIAQALESDK